MSDQRTCLDLFSGAGGMTLGLHAAGFETVGAVEYDSDAGETFEANFGDVPVGLFGDEGDMREVEPARIGDLLSEAGHSSVDLLTAGPPCQGFSHVGRAKLDSVAGEDGAHVNDERNSLFRRALRVLELLKPQAFLLENVPGMLNLSGSNVAENVCRAVEDRGYRVKVTVLNSAWYGVPQTRQRVFVLAYRHDLNLTPEFPVKRHKLSDFRTKYANGGGLEWKDDSHWVSPRDIPVARTCRAEVKVSDALDDLPEFTQHLEALNSGERYSARRERFDAVPYRRAPHSEYADEMRSWEGFESDEVTDHYCRWTPRDFKTFRRMDAGDRYPEALEQAKLRFEEALDAWNGKGSPPQKDDFVPPYSATSFRDKWRKLDPDRPSWTVTAHLSKDTYSHIHHDSAQARGISIREAARLQSFPDGFEFSGSTGAVYRQIGNAVPPLMANALGEQIIETLETSSENATADGDIRGSSQVHDTTAGL